MVWYERVVCEVRVAIDMDGSYEENFAARVQFRNLCVVSICISFD